MKNNHGDKDSYLQVAFAYHFIIEKVADNTPLRIEGKIFIPFKQMELLNEFFMIYRITIWQNW